MQVLRVVLINKRVSTKDNVLVFKILFSLKSFLLVITSFNLISPSTFSGTTTSSEFNTPSESNTPNTSSVTEPKIIIGTLPLVDEELRDAEYWYFHTGEGFSITEWKNPDTGVLEQIMTHCTIDVFDPYCYEKVYYFSSEEIDNFVQVAINIREERLYNHNANLILGSTVFVVSTKYGFTGLAAPEPTLLTKIIGGFSLATAGIAAIYVAWEGENVWDILDQLEKIDYLLADEKRFATRCHHVRKSFLDRVSRLGISVIFPKYGGRLIKGDVYLAAMAREKALHNKTIDYARRKNISLLDAYKHYFNEQCGQLPIVHGSTIEKSLSILEKLLPYKLVEKTVLVSNKLNLFSRSLIEFSNLNDSLVLDKNWIDSVTRFLNQVDRDIDWLENIGGIYGYKQLKRIRSKVDKIIVRYRSSFSSFSYSSGGKPYTIQSIGGKITVILYAEWSSTKNAYQIGWRQFLKEYFDIQFLVYCTDCASER